MTILATAALTLSGLAVTASAEEPEAPATSAGRTSAPEAQPDAVARGLIVQTSTPGVSDGVLETTDDALGGEANVVDDAKLTGKISTIRFDEEVGAELATEAASDLERRADVVWAVPDTLRQRQYKPPGYPNYNSGHQWNLWDVVPPKPAGGYTIKAPGLWRKTSGSSEVRVAVLDTGVTGHAALAGQQVPGYDMVGPDDPKAAVKTYFTANDGDGRDPDPADPGDWVTSGQCYRNSRPAHSSWHGTFVAGQIASNGEYGIRGIARDSKVQAVRVLGRCGGWDSDILAGITWSSGGSVAGVPDNQYPSQIVNLSLGYTYSRGADRDRACKSYAAAAAAGRARGAIFVAAAGNDGANANLAVPASCPGYISVGALGRQGFSATYSNVGSSVDLSAPGGDTLVGGERELIPSLGDQHRSKPGVDGTLAYEGTSMAAPQVSAGAALILSVLSQPDPNAGPVTVSPAKLEAAVLASTTRFRAKSATYAKKKVVIGGRTYTFDLNCSGHTWCGRGMFDLSRVHVPQTEAQWGVARHVVHEPFSAYAGSWQGNPELRFQWFRISADFSEMHPVGTDSRFYYPTPEDAGAMLQLKITPKSGLYSEVSQWTDRTGIIRMGPTVSMTLPTGPVVYGTPFTTSVVVSGLEGGGPLADQVEDAPVAVQADDVTLTEWTDLVDGKAELTIPGEAWKVGSHRIRTTYDGKYDSVNHRVITLASASPFQVVTVVKANATVGTSLISAIKRTSNAKLSLTVSVPGVPQPSGALKIYDGSRVIANSYLYGSSNGKKTITLPRLAKGKHQIRVRYAGNANINAKYSAYETIVSK
ncbi:S8 family serine peptidase [Aeromicrobium sp. NPDC092404]|uniref:S8 family serine peptidase n=1 Tax=Aeromicrobium sp. NPDC092404 TaxID=3154976 RepID=UPI003442293A